MPLKLSLGVSRKVGEPDYGSRGASCNVELELDGSALDRDPDSLRSRIRTAFASCRTAVQEELSRPWSVATHHEPARPSSGSATTASNGRSIPPRGATPAQVRAIHALARRLGSDLPGLLHDDFGVDRPELLTRAQASRVIDQLKQAETV
jgi:hypothetical protein